MFGEGMAMTKSQANKERAVDDKLLALTEGVRSRPLKKVRHDNIRKTGSSLSI